MKLIEKKCPNCGASLEFSDTDKSCKCSYCHRAFEIERDKSIDNDYNLVLAKTNDVIPAKVFIIPIIFVFIIAFLIIGFVFFNIFDFNKDINTVNTINDKSKKNTYFKDVSELSNSDYESIDNDAIFEISATAVGNNNDHSFSKDGEEVREKVYVAYKNTSNYIISVYKVVYRDFFHKENSHTIYVPIQYENINKNSFDKFKNPQVKAPEYYFNEEKTNYTYGYRSIDEIYNNLIKPLKDDGYKITEK